MKAVKWVDFLLPYVRSPDAAVFLYHVSGRASVNQGAENDQQHHVYAEGYV